jgi:hypothetical protein
MDKSDSVYVRPEAIRISPLDRARLGWTRFALALRRFRKRVFSPR